jgi:UDP-glucose 4-epimerase
MISQNSIIIQINYAIIKNHYIKIHFVIKRIGVEMVIAQNREKYFITGGAGFIGSHLVKVLLDNQNEVTVYDNLSSGTKDNLSDCIKNKRFKFIEADLLDTEALMKAMSGHSTVWHLGANTDIQKGNQIFDYDFKNSTLATFNVLEAMRLNGIYNILFSSSSTVYGEGLTGLLSESSGPLFPISLYGAGKLGSEGFISAYSHLHGIRAVMFRFANVIGARMSHGVIHDFILKLKQDNKELEILGNGSQEKPYILVEDCIEAMCYASEKSKAQCEVFNLGCESVTSVTKVAEIVIQEMGLKNVNYRYTGGTRGWPGDIAIVHYDISKIQRLGWQAKHSSDEAVRIATRRLLINS